MAEEPQPPNVHEGADAAKASAALSSLDRNDDDVETSNKSADTEALGKAMASLDVKDAAKEAKEAPKKVKLDAEDVKLLVKELEVSMIKAKDLLGEAGGDAVKALTAYITAPI